MSSSDLFWSSSESSLLEVKLCSVWLHTIGVIETIVFCSFVTANNAPMKSWCTSVRVPEVLWGKHVGEMQDLAVSYSAASKPFSDPGSGAPALALRKSWLLEFEEQPSEDTEWRQELAGQAFWEAFPCPHLLPPICPGLPFCLFVSFLSFAELLEWRKPLGAWEDQL